jgi:Na+-driven multidrug efflux pump
MYGPGVYLFFEFLWKLSLLFLVLTLISFIPIIYNYLQGNRFSNSVSSLSVYISEVSISNFYGNNPLESSTQQISSTKVPKLINCATDLLNCFIVMIFYFYWTGKSEKITE